MSARHRQAARRKREAKLAVDAVLREAGSVAAAVIEAKLPAAPRAPERGAAILIVEASPGFPEHIKHELAGLDALKTSLALHFAKKERS